MKKLPVFLEIEEIRAMLAAANTPRDHLLIHLMYKTGLRVHEVTSLKIEHIELDNRQMFVISGKGNKDRVVDVDDELADEIRRFIGDRTRGILFETPHDRLKLCARYVKRQGPRKKDGKTIGRNIKEIRLEPGQLSDRSVQEIVKSVATQSGVQKAKAVTPHTLRHTYACQCLIAGVNIASIQKAMGHTNLATTQVYIEAVQTREHVRRDFGSHPLPQVENT